MQIRKHRTTILIDNDHEPNDDWKYLQKRGLKPTNLLRKKIKDLKETDLYGNVDYKEANERLHARLTKLCEILNKILSKEQFEEIMQKI